jgi:PhzF family phenazine biosynthesis protein
MGFTSANYFGEKGPLRKIMNTPLYQVDAFTSEAFRGNPAAVVMLSQENPNKWMQSIAKEMNLSETAFLLHQHDCFNLRWFTPKMEVTLCGHATLASAHILYTKGYLRENEKALFKTASGMLTARFIDSWIELNFPKLKVIPEVITDEINQALGFKPKQVFRTDVNLLVEMDKPEDVENYKPYFMKLADLPFQGLIITAYGKDNQYDFISRYFAPQAGIDEDPVTGSAHCSLAPYWASKLNKREFIAYQASERGGLLKLSLDHDRVLLKGQAMTIFSGELEV